MKDFKLALVAQDSRLGAKDQNLAATLQWVDHAAEAGADLVCFPELNITGHGGHVSMIEAAEELPHGPACQQLQELAQELDIYIGAGIVELHDVAVYNTYFIVGPEGFVGKQRKLFMSSDEYFFFRHGTRIPVFNLPFAKVGVVICFDNEHPEPARCLGVQGAEVILSPHAARCLPHWPPTDEEEGREAKLQLDHWEMVHRCRAWDNACYVALCNAAGPSCEHLDDVEANHAGGCMVVGFKGQVLARTQEKKIQEEMIVVPLDADSLRQHRNRHCLPLRVRRPEVFRLLSQSTE